MLRSMTGFGIAETETDKVNIKVEVKSLNGKFFELNLRMPRQWQHKELELRRELSKWIERGSVTVNINLTYKHAEDVVSPINTDVVTYYVNQLKSISEQSNIELSQLLNNVFDMPGVISNKDSETNDEDWKQIFNTVKSAFDNFETFRNIEGNMLLGELEKLCHSIMNKLSEIEPYEEARIKFVKDKITKELSSISNDMVDKNRFEQELIYYIEKLDISEEKARLKQHGDYFLNTLKENSSGKKLSFIAQEIGREINTIGSKANEINIQKRVIEMKDDLEKIKEQLNNVL
ncbi:MAG: YicC family protein [Bacteroidetes bacterium]|nr:YicC family protein [Bacteroidota bacterium]